MSNELERFGDAVRQARLDRGWTQEELSARSTLATVQISRVERGAREIRLSTLIKLLDALEVEPNVLLADVVGRRDSE